MDRVTQLLLTLFGQDAEVVLGEEGEPIALRISIPLNHDLAGVQDALKLSSTTDEEHDDVGNGPVCGPGDRARAGGY